MVQSFTIILDQRFKVFGRFGLNFLTIVQFISNNDFFFKEEMSQALVRLTGYKLVPVFQVVTVLLLPNTFGKFLVVGLHKLD